MGSFKYVGLIVPMALVEYLLIILLVRHSYNKSHDEPLSLKTLVEVAPFEHTYRSLNERVGAIGLLVCRVAFFCWFLIAGCIMTYVASHGHSWYYFTIWNLELLGTYFGLAIVCSAFGMMNDQRNGSRYSNSWGRRISLLNKVTQIMFSVAGATALFVTLISFVLLNPEFSYWNVTHHLTNSIAMLIELCLNKIPVEKKYIVFNMSWALVYLYFIIPVKAAHAVNEWPYSFLTMATPSCVGWYTMLIVVNILFFLMWDGLSRLVEKYLHTKSAVRHGGVAATAQHAPLGADGSVHSEQNICMTGGETDDEPRAESSIV